MPVGTNGSTETDFEFGFPAEFAASAGSLNSNINRPVTEGADFPFDTCSAVQPQTNCLPLKMKAVASVDVVFEATLASRPGLIGEDWFLSFGGNRDAEFTSDITVTVERSTDGITYTSVQDVEFTVVDTEFVVDLGAELNGLSTVFVRLGLVGTDTNLTGANIDNLALSATVVPEPGTAALLGLGLAGLAGVGRSRRGETCGQA